MGTREIVFYMILKAEKVSKYYESSKGDKINALFPVSIEVNKGEFVAIIGDSGSGKSTLLNILSGLDSPTTGEVFFNNKSLKCSPSELAIIRNQNFGFVFQTPHMIFHKTVLENILLPWQYSNKLQIDAAIEKAHQLLDYIGLSGFGERKPSTLSGGELQRIAFARAILLQPKIIFADEPTAGLDKNNADKIMSLLLEQNKQGITIILVSHNEKNTALSHRQFHLQRAV